MPTPYGAYYYDWVDEMAVGPAVEAALAALPQARAAHAEVVKVTALLMKAKKVVEAGPHSAEDITADVTRHASGAAGDMAASADMSKRLGALVNDLITAAHGNLVSTQTRWELALDAHDIAADKQEAAALKEEVRKEKEEIDEAIKKVKSLFGLASAVVKLEAKEVASGLFEMIVDAYHELNGQERLARAKSLEEMAKAGEIVNLAQAIEAAEADLEKAVSTMEALHTRAAEVKEGHQKQAERAALAYDKGSKGKLKLIPLMKALRGSAQLYGLAAEAVAKARAARRAGGDLARVTTDGHARIDECRQVIDKMLKAARGWEEQSQQTMQRCERLTAHWQSLHDAALAAMRGADGKGKTMDDLLALDR
ncbi:MAG: hypothetical protein ABW220_16795 [Burkholderiaceae bacterium]